MTKFRMIALAALFAVAALAPALTAAGGASAHERQEPYWKR